MSKVPEHAEATKGRAPARSEGSSKVGTNRIDIQRLEQKTLEATYKSEDKSFQVLMDEPSVRGGLSRGPSPLGYFVTGAGG